MKIIQRSLSAQMLLALILLSIVPLTLVGIITFHSGRQIIISNVQTHLKTVGILKRHAIDQWVNQLQFSFISLSTDKHLIDEVAALTAQKQQGDTYTSAYNSLSSRFKQLIDLGQITHISLIDQSTGQITVSSAPSWVGKFENSSAYFVQGKEGVYVSEIFLSLSMRRPTMVVSGPVLSPEGTLLGVLTFHANFNQLSAIMLERTGLSQTTETFLVNKANLLITNTVFAPEGAFKKWIFGEGAIRAISGESDVDLFKDYREKEVIGAYFWLPERKLALIAKQDVAEAFAPIGELKKKIFLIGFGIVISIVLTGMFFGHKIIRPLKKLVAGTEAVGRGNLDFRIKSLAQDEIGTLSRAFDKMAENLKHITISLDEKEVLLREIHHRVKNNLQMIQSLLSLQIGQLTDSNAVAPLKDSMLRISSIAMVHETLYKSDDLSTIDLQLYFKELVNYLIKSLKPSNVLVDIDCNIEQLPLKLDSVIACGMIINELITNSLKYAFVDTDVGEISIELQAAEEATAELIVADNGIGIPDPEAIKAKHTLGTDLVHILAKNQLEGSVQIVHKPGLKYIIRFPL